MPPCLNRRLELLRAYLAACADEGLLPKASFHDAPAAAAALARRVAEDAALLAGGASLGAVAGRLAGARFGGAFAEAAAAALGAVFTPAKKKKKTSK